jgi:hypothetical protein
MIPVLLELLGSDWITDIDRWSLINTFLADSAGLEKGIILQPRAIAVCGEMVAPFPNKVHSAVRLWSLPNPT